MPRTTVQLVTGERYHIYNRGVDKRDVFIDKQDYLRFYQSLAFFNSSEPTINYRLAKSAYKNGASPLVEVLAYALLPNHYHLILRQKVDGGMSEFMKRVSAGYTGYFNEKNNRSGSLFQGNYKRVHIASDEQYQFLFAYVNENHFVHGISMDLEICHTSSLFYQKKLPSKLIKKTGVDYDHKHSVRLACDIHKKRSEAYSILE